MCVLLTVEEEGEGVAQVGPEHGGVLDLPGGVVPPAVGREAVAQGVRHVGEGVLTAVRIVHGDRHRRGDPTELPNKSPA